MLRGLKQMIAAALAAFFVLEATPSYTEVSKHSDFSVFTLQALAAPALAQVGSRLGLYKSASFYGVAKGRRFKTLVTGITFSVLTPVSVLAEPVLAPSPMSPSIESIPSVPVSRTLSRRLVVFEPEMKILPLKEDVPIVVKVNKDGQFQGVDEKTLVKEILKKETLTTVETAMLYKAWYFGREQFAADIQAELAAKVKTLMLLALIPTPIKEPVGGKLWIVYFNISEIEKIKSDSRQKKIDTFKTDIEAGQKLLEKASWTKEDLAVARRLAESNALETGFSKVMAAQRNYWEPYFEITDPVANTNISMLLTLSLWDPGDIVLARQVLKYHRDRLGRDLAAQLETKSIEAESLYATQAQVLSGKSSGWNKLDEEWAHRIMEAQARTLTGSKGIVSPEVFAEIEKRNSSSVGANTLSPDKKRPFVTDAVDESVLGKNGTAAASEIEKYAHQNPEGLIQESPMTIDPDSLILILRRDLDPRNALVTDSKEKFFRSRKLHRMLGRAA